MKRSAKPKQLSYLALGLIILGYLVIIQGGGLLVRKLLNVEGSLVSTKNVVLNMWLPLGAALVYTYALIEKLNLREPVLHEKKRVQKWVWVVPIVLIVCILVAVDYTALGDKTLGYILTLLIATQLVGWGEEGMFRGISLTTLRSHGLTEGKAALWSSLIFGSVHLSNAVTRGARAIPQALIVSFAGYFFYLTRRASGGNRLNSVLHGFFDFSILTGTVILVDQKPYVGSTAAILAYVVIAIILLVRRKKIELVSGSLTR